jgi:hypothetical protein
MMSTNRPCHTEIRTASARARARQAQPSRRGRAPHGRPHPSPPPLNAHQRSPAPQNPKLPTTELPLHQARPAHALALLSILLARPFRLPQKASLPLSSAPLRLAAHSSTERVVSLVFLCRLCSRSARSPSASTTTSSRSPLAAMITTPAGRGSRGVGRLGSRRARALRRRERPAVRGANRGARSTQPGCAPALLRAGPQGRGVRFDLLGAEVGEWQSAREHDRARDEVAEREFLTPAPWVRDGFGEPPDQTWAREQWEEGVRRVARYRAEHEITDQSDPLGPRPEVDEQQQHDWSEPEKRSDTPSGGSGVTSGSSRRSTSGWGSDPPFTLR